eukprot:887779-Ditylum_brightwellii.AAC.1
MDLLHQPCPAYTDFFTKVETYYKNMLLSGKWVNDHSTESVFLGNTPPQPLGPDPPCTTTGNVCIVCRGKHSKNGCPKVKWYRREVHCCPTQNDKKVQNDPDCYKKFINRKLHKYCEHCGFNKHGALMTKQEEKGHWNISHHCNEYHFQSPTTGTPQANIATNLDTKEEKLIDGCISVSFKDAVLKAA